MADWQASDGTTTHSFSNNDFMAAVHKLKKQLSDSQTADHIEYLRFLNNAFGQSPQSKTPPKWKSVDDMMAALKTQKVAQAPPKPMDPVARRKEIETELDIIRGRVPTPKGYTINPLRVKKLMQELKQLT